MEPLEVYKYLGLVYFVVIWAAMLYVLGREPHDKTKTVSRHVAAYKETFIMFAVVRTVALPLWLLFAFGWLMPVLDLPVAAYVLFAVTIVGDMISAWVPAVDGRKWMVHTLAAFVMVGAYLPLSLLFASSSNVSELARTIIWIAILFMIILWVWFMSHKESKTYYLYFQLAYFVLFDTAFLSAAFL